MPRKPVKKSKPKSTAITTLERFEAAARQPGANVYVLRLYVTGATPKSTEAIQNIKRICEEHLQGRYELVIVDIYEHPVLAAHEQIFAAPTLVKELPPPLRRLIGTMADEERVLLGLDIKPRE